MKYYLVTFVHTDLEGWKKYVNAHIRYLEKLIKEHKLIVSGPLQDAEKGEKEAILIFHVKDKKELMALLENDPYWYEGLVAEYNVREWNPMFGSLQKPHHRLLIKLSKLFNRK
ncbi:hypothetical protein AMC75_09235 [Staphylococcus carnosus]|uniref:YciI family protein n=1 Tax=Staphylococcus carnosus TaxID=1281 RepID=UPI0006ABD3AA|nr:YciI family protein [Staphylococcus carnosus]KOR12642.1 hypothetical protein AMC75_09235 [Staphylococcus carnosus]